MVSPKAMTGLIKTLNENPNFAYEIGKEGFDALKTVSGPFKDGLKFLKPFVGDVNAGAIDKAVSGLEWMGLGKKGKKAKKAPTGKKSARGQLISKIMKERGVKLGEASKIIKSEGLM